MDESREILIARAFESWKYYNINIYHFLDDNRIKSLANHIDKELERMERGNKRNCDNNIQHIRN